jgi:hypothetical protein
MEHRLQVDFANSTLGVSDNSSVLEGGRSVLRNQSKVLDPSTKPHAPYLKCYNYHNKYRAI